MCYPVPLHSGLYRAVFVLGSTPSPPLYTLPGPVVRAAVNNKAHFRATVVVAAKYTASPEKSLLSLTPCVKIGGVPPLYIYISMQECCAVVSVHTHLILIHIYITHSHIYHSSTVIGSTSGPDRQKYYNRQTSSKKVGATRTPVAVHF